MWWCRSGKKVAKEVLAVADGCFLTMEEDVRWEAGKAGWAWTKVTVYCVCTVQETMPQLKTQD